MFADDSSATSGSVSHEPGEELGEAIRVFVRIRPLSSKELADQATMGWNFTDTAMLEDTQNGQRVYAYDRCFGPASTNIQVYEVVGRPVVLKGMEGKLAAV
jgi:hypothetical protein